MSQVTSESILTTKTIVEQAIKDYHAQILPYLNGEFPIAVAERFAEGNLYTTDEKIIGQWIDGKPIYQKTFKLPDQSIKNAKIEYVHGIDNIDSVVGTVEGSANYMANGVTPIPYSIPYLNIADTNSNSGMAAFSGNSTNIMFTTYNFSYVFVDIYATIRYTKTTDEPVSFGTDTYYSTTEKVIGTWIDGKPIYQKTFTDLSVATKKDGFVSTGIAQGAIETIVNGLCYTSTGALVKLDCVDKINSYINIYANLGANITSITLQYTKTTD